MKYDFVRTHETQFRVAALCRVLRVSRSGYYEWRDRAPSVREQTDERLLEEIRRVHHAHYEAYGALKTWRALNGQGIGCGKHRVARIRREARIEAKRKRRFRIITDNKGDATLFFESAVKNKGKIKGTLPFKVKKKNKGDATLKRIKGTLPFVSNQR